MNITDVSSSTRSSFQIDNPWRQNRQDFRGLSQALQSGDLTKAQDAFASWQKDLQNVAGKSADPTSSSTDPFGQNTKANADFQQLSKALQSGDLDAAKTAFTSLKKDLRGAGHAHHAHHAHRPDGDADDANSSTATSASGTNSASTGNEPLLNVQA